MASSCECALCNLCNLFTTTTSNYYTITVIRECLVSFSAHFLWTEY